MKKLLWSSCCLSRFCPKKNFSVTSIMPEVMRAFIVHERERIQKTTFEPYLRGQIQKIYLSVSN